ncbi:hypothetical protein K502DRAFT_367471 [Neoconidiobolus thromboides FSU 785]|nr:hypothetical protein K502DRAFT_367471 [Neoconidiobolus thromboides FSU 785]
MFGKEIGKLQITLVEGRNLHNEDTTLVGKNDAYVIIKCNHKKEKSQVIKGAGSSAQWNETFEFPIKDDSEVEVSIYDKDTLIDDKIGEATIPIQGLVQNGFTESWYGVGKGSKNRGEVLLRIQYHANQ